MKIVPVSRRAFIKSSTALGAGLVLSPAIIGRAEAATLKLNKNSATPPSQQTAMAEEKAIRILDETLGLKGEAPPK